ncbi:MAG: hypothetical protein ACJAYU_002440 [Bradymonadia bacterium]|jgi:hypothetical protein
MPKEPDADGLSISDIGVDFILDAAGLNDDESAVDAGVVSSWSADLGFGADAAPVKAVQLALDEDEFPLAFDEGAPLVIDSLDYDAELSGVDSGFFGGEQEEDIWEIPAGRSEVVLPATESRVASAQAAQTTAVNDSAAPNPPRGEVLGLSQLPHFELDLPRDIIDPAGQTVLASQGPDGIPDARAGIVQKKRGTRSPAPAGFSRESSTQRPVLIRPDSQLGGTTPLDPPKNGGQVLARAHLVTKVVRRRNGAARPSAAEASIPDRIPVPANFVGDGVDDDTAPETEEEFIARKTMDFRNADSDGTPDDVRVERPIGAAALVAWMSTGDEDA